MLSNDLIKLCNCTSCLTCQHVFERNYRYIWSVDIIMEWYFTLVLSDFTNSFNASGRFLTLTGDCSRMSFFFIAAFYWVILSEFCVSSSASVFGVSPQSMQCSIDERGNSVPTILLMMQKRLYAEGGLQVCYWLESLNSSVI